MIFSDHSSIVHRVSVDEIHNLHSHNATINDTLVYRSLFSICMSCNTFHISYISLVPCFNEPFIRETFIIWRSVFLDLAPFTVGNVDLMPTSSSNGALLRQPAVGLFFFAVLTRLGPLTLKFDTATWPFRGPFLKIIMWHIPWHEKEK